MMSTPTSPQEIQSALRHPFRPSRASPPRPHHHQPLAARSPRVIRFGDEVDSDLEMFEPDDDDDGKAGLRDGKKEQVWVKEMLQELSRLGWQPTSDNVQQQPKRGPAHRSAPPRPSILATSPNHGMFTPELSSSASSRASSISSSSGSVESCTTTPPSDSILRFSFPPADMSPSRGRHRSNSLSLPHSHRLTGGSVISTSPLVAVASPVPGTAAADLARAYTANAGTSATKSAHARRMSAGGRLEVVREERED